MFRGGAAAGVKTRLGEFGTTRGKSPIDGVSKFDLTEEFVAAPSRRGVPLGRGEFLSFSATAVRSDIVGLVRDFDAEFSGRGGADTLRAESSECRVPLEATSLPLCDLFGRFRGAVLSREL